MYNFRESRINTLELIPDCAASSSVEKTLSTKKKVHFVKKEFIVIPSKEELLKNKEADLWYTEKDFQRFQVDRNLEITNYLKENNLPSSPNETPRLIIKAISRKLYQPNFLNNQIDKTPSEKETSEKIYV